MHGVDHLRGAVVAIRDGVVEQPTLAVEQAIVDPPRVDSDRLDLPVGGAQPRETREDLLVQSGEVPVEVAGALHDPVREAVHRVEGDALLLDDAGDDSAAGGAYVDGGDDTSIHPRQASHPACLPPTRSATIRSA